MSILRNAAKCLDCGDEIESIYRHDFVKCKCGNIFVDGGKDYIRRGYANKNWEDTSEFDTDDRDGGRRLDKEEIVENDANDKQ